MDAIAEDDLGAAPAAAGAAVPARVANMAAAAPAAAKTMAAPIHRAGRSCPRT